MTALNETTTGTGPAAAIEGIVDTIAASRIRSAVAIVIVALVAFLPGFNTTLPLDRDESAMVLASKAMVESGSYFGRSLPEGSRFGRPIGVHWLQAASVLLVGEGAASPIWVYRLPSLLGAIAAALLTWWMARAFGRPRAALFAALLAGATPLLAAEARLATVDTALLAAIVLTQGALARIWLKKTEAPDLRLAFLFWTGLGAGVLAGALVAPLVIGLTIGVLSAVARSFAWLRRLAPLAGGLWLAVLVAPWLVALVLGGAPVGALPDSIAVQQLYQAPPGIFAVLFYPLFGAAGVFVALAIPGVLDRTRRPALVFAIAWTVPFWILMELMPGKLPYYVLPAYPALALVGGTAIDEGWVRVTGWVSTYFALNLSVWPLVVGIGATALFVAGEGGPPLAAIPFFLAGIVAGVYAFRWLYRGVSVVGSFVLSLLSSLCVYVGLFGVVIPDMTAIRISERLVAAGRAAAACDRPEFASAGFSEPSLVFHAGNRIRLTSPEEAAGFLAEGGCRVAFVEARRQPIFNQRAADIGVEFDVRGEVRGGNVGNWRWTNMRVFAADGPAP